MSYLKLPIVVLSEMVSSRADSINGHIAAYILTHIEEVRTASVRELAGKAHVSASSISRFCREIGLADYNELKELSWHTTLDFKICSSSETASEQKSDYVSMVQKSLDLVRDSVEMEKLQQLCLDIRSYPKVAVFGVMKSEGVAMNLQADLMRQGKIVVTKLPFSEQIDYLENADADSLIIIFSYRGIYFQYGFPRNFQKPRSKRSKIWFVTSDPKAASSGLYDGVIWFESLQDQTSHPYQLQLIADLIAQSYAHLQKNALPAPVEADQKPE